MTRRKALFDYAVLIGVAGIILWMIAQGIGAS